MPQIPEKYKATLEAQAKQWEDTDQDTYHAGRDSGYRQAVDEIYNNILLTMDIDADQIFELVKKMKIRADTKAIEDESRSKS